MRISVAEGRANKTEKPSPHRLKAQVLPRAKSEQVGRRETGFAGGGSCAGKKGRHVGAAQSATTAERFRSIHFCDRMIQFILYVEMRRAGSSRPPVRSGGPPGGWQEGD